MDYNLLEEKWIPVLCKNGETNRVNIIEALTQAHRIRQIAASNPLDRAAILRFLLALLYWCKGNPDKLTLAFPPDWFKKLDDNKDYFNLLGEGKRFYQDPRTPQNDRPIGDLLTEFPTETKIAHFRHVRDKEYGLCPACCAIGIIRFSAWANAYGGGRYTSAVNGPSPAYAIAHGETLFHTLIINWTAAHSPRREPPWLNDETPQESNLDKITVMAWRSRQLWLGNLGDSDETCVYCGRQARLIRQMNFTGCWKLPFEAKGQQKKFWDKDPHLIVVEEHKDEEVNSQDAEGKEQPSQEKRPSKDAAKKTTLGFPLPGSKTAVHARFWRRALRAITPASKSVGDASSTIVLTGPAVNKGLYQDAAEILLKYPNKNAEASLEMISKGVESINAVLKRSTPNPQRQHPNRRAMLDAMSPSFEAHFHEEVEANPAAAVTPDDIARRLEPIVENIVRATTPGSPLRRHEALRWAGQKLAQTAKNSTKDDNPPVTSDAPDKAKRRLREKEKA